MIGQIFTFLKQLARDSISSWGSSLVWKCVSHCTAELWNSLLSRNTINCINAITVIKSQPIVKNPCKSLDWHVCTTNIKKEIALGRIVFLPPAEFQRLEEPMPNRTEALVAAYRSNSLLLNVSPHYSVAWNKNCLWFLWIVTLRSVSRETWKMGKAIL